LTQASLFLGAAEALSRVSSLSLPLSFALKFFVCLFV